ncbi:hypothetical protein BDV18DRAFT_164222 [Aspergillus unguis]
MESLRKASRNTTSKRPPKLRSACNECHAAKVRCTGEKTGCQRCTTQQLKCAFSISRIGKVPGKRSRANRTSVTVSAANTVSGAAATPTTSMSTISTVSTMSPYTLQTFDQNAYTESIQEGYPFTPTESNHCLYPISTSGDPPSLNTQYWPELDLGTQGAGLLSPEWDESMLPPAIYPDTLPSQPPHPYASPAEQSLSFSVYLNLLLDIEQTIQAVVQGVNASTTTIDTVLSASGRYLSTLSEVFDPATRSCTSDYLLLIVALDKIIYLLRLGQCITIMIAQTRRRRALPPLILLGAVLLVLWLHSSNFTWHSAPTLSADAHGRRITKVSMLYGPRNTLYERALQSHTRHAQRWGYGMDVLQNDIAVGYWNKPAYLLALVVGELAKPVVERTEWFMWVDADSIMINSLIPLEIFLPPTDLKGVHMVATKDHKGLNTGIFFLRVHQWTVRMLIESLAYPTYNPGTDLGMQVDQTAMEKVLNKTEYRDGVVYLPRPWINTYEWRHAYEGEKGHMLVHFPGLGEDRWSHMQKWLDVVEAEEEWEVEVQETWYLDETRQFWERIRHARDGTGHEA